MLLEELMSSGTVRPITRWGTPVLHRPCRPVADFGSQLWGLVSDMFATNAAADGAGLAAPQIGVDLAVFVYDCNDGFDRRRFGVVCNPVVAAMAEPRLDEAMEGCLSLPGAYLPVSRPDVAVCRGQDHLGTPIRVVGTGVLARCLQHETDHLSGVVMEDHLGEGERLDLRRQHQRVAGDYPDGWPA